LGIELPYRENLGPLFQPLSIAGRILANRLAVQPMEGADAEPDGSPGLLTFRRYRRFGAGGCGLIWFEAAAVTPAGRSNPSQLLLDAATLDGFKRLVEETRVGAGPGASPLLILQLTHSGRFSRPEGLPAPVIARHDPRLDALQRLSSDHPLIADSDLDRLKDRFTAAAELARRAGFDGVDIKACHGYLVSELLAARGRSASRYGGGFENRVRFLVETTRAVHAAEPKLLLACRLGLFDALPGGFGVDSGDSGRPDPAEPSELIKRLTAEGTAVIDVTAGIPALRAHFGRPFDRPAAGAAPADEHPLEGVGRLLGLSARVQKDFPELIVVGTGYSWLRQFFPGVASAVVAAGCASIAGLGRLSFACPDFASRLRDRGTLATRDVCVACSGCSTLLRAGGPVGCIVRDAAVYRLPR
jgi:2,4-dienoyl-CoA reductase-like NADH-dependent reductase (Old Yellow Enzyme family)